MTDDILISVIVPVYNGERFIDRAIQSVLLQIDGTVELILVNDGSTAGSGAICDAYAAGNANVRVIHKPNGGISSARNAGIAAATGKYLMFLDADDYLEKETCGEIGNVIREHSPDCIDFGWKYVSKSGEITTNHHKIQKNVILGEEVLRNEILPPLLNLLYDPDHFVFDFSCTKVFRRNIIQDNSIAFDETRRIWEDRPFVVQYLKYCRSFYSVDQCFYNYVDVPGSLSRKYSMDFFRIILENFQLYKHLYGDIYDFDTEYANTYWCRAIENMIVRSLEEKENQEQIRKNIYDTLQNKQVIYWFSARIPEGKYEEKMSQYIVLGEYEKALRGYEKRLKKARRRYRLSAFKTRVGRFLRR